MKIKLFLILLLIVVHIIPAWSNGSSQVTDFYYYKGKPYKLSIRNDKIFIKTKEVMDESHYRTLLAQYFQFSPQTNFDKNIREQFVNLSVAADSRNLNLLISSLKQNNQIELASVVYSPDENSKVLQGLEDNVIAQFKPYVTTGQIDTYLRTNGLTIEKQMDISGGTTYLLHINSLANTTTIDVANQIYESGLVNWADPGFYFSGLLCFTPNDTFYPMQWSIKNTGNNIPGGVVGTAGCDMRVDSAWNITLGSSHCVVGMVDTGIDTLHEDIAGNMLHGLNYDFINGHPGGIDDYNHGTCTGGIVAAVGNNGIGISGVCPGAKLIAIKIFNSAGSTSTAAITSGLQYSWQQGEWISSNSWGGGSPIAAADQTIQDGTTSGRGGKGTVFCFATGNNNGAVTWPATNAYCIAVGGNSPCNQRKSTTSCDGENFWGADYGTGTSIVAPCVKVYATDRMGAPGYDPSNYFATFNGTSSATPNCAGVCALVMSRDSTLRWDTVRARICWTADKVGAYSYTSAGPYAQLGNTWNNEMGYGKINAYRLLLTTGPPPPPLPHNISCGPFMHLPVNYLINTPYNIVTQIANIGANTETGVPIKWFVDGALINTTNKNLAVNQIDSVSNTFQTASAGNHTLMYVSALATDLDRTNDTVKITVNFLAALPPLCEQFDGATFPPAQWTITGAGSSYWLRGTASGFGLGTGSAVYNMWSAPSGTDGNLNSLTFPSVNAGAQLFVDMAYSPYPATPPYDQDSLVILASTDGGATYISITRLGPTQLQTVAASSSQFVPTAAQWVKRTYSIPTGTNKIQFLGRSAFGNDLYLDSICVNSPLGISNNGNTLPSVYSLGQNYPNPFNPSTNIAFGIPKAGIVKMVIYDVLGRVVQTLVNEYKPAGSYKVDFDASKLASGVYFYRLESGDFTDVKKMLLIK